MPITKRERKYPFRRQHVSAHQEESAWQCETCPAPTENLDSRWCLSCRMYWEDCKNGLWAGEAA